jgi:hypothetical protein
MTTTKKAPKAPAPALAPAAVAAAPTKRDPNELRIQGDPSETTGQRLAKVALGPTAQNALTALTYAERAFGSVEIQNACDALDINVNAVHDGNLSAVEATLMSQAIALNVIFNSLARRSHLQDQVKHLDTFLRLALKAQNQSRMTLETLAAIKNPPVVFARQANIANGPQQVNNAASLPSATPAANIQTAETKLLEASHDQRLDTRAARPASRLDPQLAPVGKLHGPKVR